MEIAVYDLFGQLYNAPLYKMLGGGDPVVTTDITISVDYIDKMVADSLQAVERGFEALKIKVGKDIGVDIERVKAIYAAVEDRALLRLDANQGWTAKQAVYALQTLEDAGVKLELVEQPVKAQDLEGMRYVTERVHTPIMADESVFGPTQVIELIRMRAADIINIKLMKTGGISSAIHIADIAAHARHRMHDRLHARDQHQRGGRRSPGGRQIRRDHQGGPRRAVAVRVQPGGRRRDLQRIGDLDHRRAGPGHPRDPRALQRLSRRSMSSLVKIRAERDQMSAIERRIADFMLENAHLLRDYSSQQLADALQISQSSVVKFSQKLGFKGYPDLKYSIGEAVARGSDAPVKAAAKSARYRGSGVARRNVVAEQVAREEETRLINDAGTLNEIATLLSRAAKVFCIGFGEDGIAAQAFAQRLALLGTLAVHHTDAVLMTATHLGRRARRCADGVLRARSARRAQSALPSLSRAARQDRLRHPAFLQSVARACRCHLAGVGA